MLHASPQVSVVAKWIQHADMREGLLTFAMDWIASPASFSLEAWTPDVIVFEDGALEVTKVKWGHKGWSPCLIELMTF